MTLEQIATPTKFEKNYPAICFYTKSKFCKLFRQSQVQLTKDIKVSKKLLKGKYVVGIMVIPPDISQNKIILVKTPTY